MGVIGCLNDVLDRAAVTAEDVGIIIQRRFKPTGFFSLKTVQFTGKGTRKPLGPL